MNEFAVDYSGLQKSVNSALDAPQQMQENALRAEEVKIKRQQIEAYQKPVTIGEFMKNVPDWMQKPMMEVAKQGGMVEQNGKDVFIRAGKIKELQKEITSNDILKAQMYEKSITYSSEEEDQNNRVLPQLEAKFAPLLQSEQAKIKNMTVKTKNEYGQDTEIPDVQRQSDAQKKLQDMLNQMPEYVQHQKFSKRNMELKVNRMRGVWRMGLLDKEFEKNAEEFGMEGAIQIANNREMKNVFINQKKKAEYELKAQAELPSKMAMEKEKQENKIELEKLNHENRIEEKSLRFRESNQRDNDYKKEKEDEKRKNKAYRDIEAHIKDKYIPKIEELEKKQKYQPLHVNEKETLAKFKEAKMIAERTINQLRNDEISLDEVKWGKSNQKGGEDKIATLKQDLMDNGYNEAQANDYIAKARKAGKI